MQTINIETIITLVMMVSTGLLGWRQWRSKSHVENADKLSKIGDTYDKLLDNMQHEIDVLKSKVADLESKYDRQVEHNRLLVKQLFDAGIEPISLKDVQ